MTFLILLAVVAAGVGYFKYRQGEQWGQLVVFGAVGFTLLLLVVRIFIGGASPAEEAGEALRDRELRYVEVAAHKLGHGLSTLKPDTSGILVVVPLSDGRREGTVDAITKGLYEGLRIGFGKDIPVVTLDLPLPPEVANYDPDNVEMIENAPVVSDWLTSQFFNQHVAAALGSNNVVVSYVGIPTGFEASGFQQQHPTVTFGTVGGQSNRISALLQSGHVKIAVRIKSGAKYDEIGVPDDIEEAFARRYELITGQ